MECNDGEDLVLFAVALPTGSILDDVRIKLQFMCGTQGTGANMFDIVDTGAIAFEAYILPVLDPDAATAVNTVWDNLVAKDTDTDVLDLDTGAADATAFWEPGEMAMDRISDVGLRPRQLMHHHRLLTAGNRQVVWAGQDNQTAFLVEMVLGGQYNVSMRPRARVSQPSVLAVAVGVPLLDDTLATAPTSLAEAEWSQVQYMKHTLERAILHQLGVFETGAETPWEEASALLRKHLNPDVYEQVANMFVLQGEYSITGEASISHRVPGELSLQSVATGR